MEDEQTEIMFPIYEGERTIANANHLLGEFTLTKIPRAKAGVPNVVVSFKIDQNGILTAGAKEMSSGSSTSVTIQNDADRLTKDQIEKMIAEVTFIKAYAAEPNRNSLLLNNL